MSNVGFVAKIGNFDYIIFLNPNGYVVKRRTKIIDSAQFVDKKHEKYLNISFDKHNRILFDVLQVSDIIIEKPSIVRDVVLKMNDECAICVQKIRRRGCRSYSHPNNCEHVFCTKCLKIWSQNHNSCPICRTTYIFAVKKSSVDSNLITKNVYPGTIKFLLDMFVTKIKFVPI
ncbi:hypothetical protein TF1A_00118 [Chrysodeixis chalcites SNPV TF1-A]|uniref:RING-type domain-containing protein n=1 Tax=Chrysodeixis chalcites nucleopolyhedrovirus TaxID=320432 RepID=T1QZ98_9ABAC|nr:hypothetical protein TF1A_00118 [Chrysodeixis chalcites SNPV TF1-A]AGE61524.1 hypothetical protein [Chrysodeixis chalcites nucleopolyhedrovirus]